MSQNTWSHRLARVAVRPLVGTRVTPNHLTTARLVSGVAALGAFAVGTPVWNNLGGVLFVISAFLDRADGELARLGGASSQWGHLYDLISDALITALLFVAVGVGLRDGFLGRAAVPMGVVAGLAVALIFWLVARMETQGEELIPGKAGFDADDILYLIGPIAWLGALAPLLVAAFVGAPAFAAWMLWRYRRLWLAGLRSAR